MKGKLWPWNKKQWPVTKTDKGTLQKRLDNHEKRNLCLWRGICVFEARKKGFD